MRRATTLLLAAAAGLASLLSAGPARAQMAHVPDNDWRQPDRHDAITKAAAKPGFVVEVRLGPYLPDVDSGIPKTSVNPATGQPYTPFADVFGLDCDKQTFGSVKPRVLFGFEVDYLAARVPYVGTVGPGLGWSFTQFSNRAQLSSTSRAMPMCSGEATTFTIMPMHASVVLRADELMRRTGIPFVPYGKFGVGMAWWRSSNDLGTETVCGTKDNPVKCMSAGSPSTGRGDGITPNLHFALGGMLSLNWIEPQVSARLEQTTGVHHAYLYGEYYNDRLAIASNVMRVGAQSWVAGLAIDF
jgi:hypothetical protein